MHAMHPFFTNMRPVIMLTILLLLIAFGALAVQLNRQVNELRTSSIDNIQWSLSQLEVELGHYVINLHEARAADEPDIDAVRFGFDIFVSRLELVRHGRVAAELDGVPQVTQILSLSEEIVQSTDAVLNASDTVVSQNLLVLVAQAEQLRPVLRNLALVGVSRFASVAEARRAAIAQRMAVTGLIALALIAVLLGMLFYVNRLLRRAEKADEAKSRFLGVMSHEMRTPINGVLGVLDLLKSSNLTPEQRRHVQIAINSSENLLDHVNQVLNITQIEAGETSLNEKPVDLRELLGEIYEQLEPLAREKNIELVLSVEPEITQKYLTDPLRLRQALNNLVGNAIKFTKSGSVSIWVGLMAEENSPETNHQPPTNEEIVQIRVRDTGQGIREEDLATIFDDFVTLDASFSRRATGTGLGLAITRRIVHAMNGKLDVKSTFGVGSVFFINLPLKPVGQDAKTGPVSAPVANAENEVALSVLVVEDNAVNRMVLREMLERLGHKVTEAIDGQSGIEAATGQEFDLIFMDVSMPGVDGIAATRQIRALDSSNANVSIMGLTAHNLAEVRRAALEAGMDRLLVKPLRLSALEKILAKHGSSAPAPANPNNASNGLSNNGKNLDNHKRANTQLEHDETNQRDEQILDNEVLGELYGVLGEQRMRQSLVRFFSQCDAGLRAIDKSASEQDWTGLADASHKLSGASALLGCAKLHLHLSALCNAAENKNELTILSHNSALPAIYAQAQKALADWNVHA